METLEIPQLKDAYSIVDERGFHLVNHFAKNKVPGIEIFAAALDYRKNYRNTKQYYFRIYSDFDFKKYENILAQLVSKENLLRIKWHCCAVETNIESLFTSAGNAFKQINMDTVYEIRGDVCSTPFHKENSYSYFNLTDSADGKLMIGIFFSHAALSEKEKVTLANLKKDTQVIVKGSLRLYDKRGTIQLQGHSIQDLNIPSLYQFEIQNQQDIFDEWYYLEHGEYIQPSSDFMSFCQSSIYTIGIITPEDSQGYEDFKSIFKKEKKLTRFYNLLPPKFISFSSPKKIIAAIEEYNQEATCDCIVILRGGGSRYDLFAFHSADLAITIAKSPIPVILGIGHSTDQFLCNNIAALSCKTPTDAAVKLRSFIARNFLSSNYINYKKCINDKDEKIRYLENYVSELEDTIELLKEENEQLKTENEKLKIENEKLKSQTFFSKLKSSLFHK